ncbi:MAG: ABC transporter ATP-binding protein [Ramlibacter sp.]|nr:ABC transporter ATP-binding protein [Ramlibacter sp.]
MTAAAQIPLDTHAGLSVRGVTVVYRSRGGDHVALSNVSLTIEPGELVGLVGESGSGKSTLAYTILRYLAPQARVKGGSVVLGGMDLLALDDQALRSLRSSRIGAVYQDASTALNPTMTIGDQLIESVRIAGGAQDPAEVRAHALRLLRRVRLSDPEAMMSRFPHQVSGGEKQRAVIAMAIVSKPALLVFDEPTTALDATTAAEILDLIRDIQAEYRTAILFITHDLASLSRFANRIVVIHSGCIVEQGLTEQILEAPSHPYTKGLLASIPNPFNAARRRRLATAAASQQVISIQRGRGELSKPPLSVRGLSVFHGRPSAWRRLLGSGDERAPAVAGIDLDLRPGRTLGLVGESGCGKSTLARAIVGLLPAQGQVVFDGVDYSHHARDRKFKRDVQIIFQHPDQALNSRMTVGDLLARPLKLYGSCANLDSTIAELLGRVHLPAHYASRYPHQLSGGEKQRVAIARAFSARPRIVICDEITSGLDVSVQASIVNLLMELQDEHGTAYLFISHDLNLVQQIADEVIVMYRGRALENRPVGGALQPPFHPYSEALLSAAPVADPAISVRRVRLAGHPEVLAKSSVGCCFQPRCPRDLGALCASTPPPWRAVGDHTIRCHISSAELSGFPPIWQVNDLVATTAKDR